MYDTDLLNQNKDEDSQNDNVDDNDNKHNDEKNNSHVKEEEKSNESRHNKVLGDKTEHNGDEIKHNGDENKNNESLNSKHDESTDAKENLVSKKSDNDSNDDIANADFNDQINETKSQDEEMGKTEEGPDKVIGDCDDIDRNNLDKK